MLKAGNSDIFSRIWMYVLPFTTVDSCNCQC